MFQAFKQINSFAREDIPVTIYYAFKQSDSDSDDHGEAKTASTGWEAMLSAIIQAGFSITGTWPMRTEMANRAIASGTNALASSIVLVCRNLPRRCLHRLPFSMCRTLQTRRLWCDKRQYHRLAPI